MILVFQIREFFGRPFFAPFLEDPLKKEDTGSYILRICENKK